MAVNEASGRLETAQLKAPSAESMIQEAEEKILERQQQFKSSAQEELTLVRAELSRLTYSKVAFKIAWIEPKFDRPWMASLTESSSRQREQSYSLAWTSLRLCQPMTRS